MSPANKNANVTIRGGIVNVPPATEPRIPVRHQPDTPRTKKSTVVKPDHQVYDGGSKNTPGDDPPIVDATPDPTPDEPEADSDD